MRPSTLRVPTLTRCVVMLLAATACTGKTPEDTADASSGENGADDTGPDETGPDDTGTSRLWYADADGDTWGNDASTVTAISAPSGYVDRGGDCDDADPSLSTPIFGSDCARPYGDCDPALGPLRLVPGDHATLSEAIEAAVSGDQVCVGPGTWMDNLDYGGKQIAVLGALGRDFTVLDGNAAGPVVIFQTAEPAGTLLQGVTLTNGYAVDDGDEANDGGGVRIYGANDLYPTLREVDILGNGATDDGGGVYIKYADPALEDMIVAENTAGDSGGGLRIVDSSPTLLRVTIRDNVVPGAGGGIAMRGGRPVFTEVVFSGNHAGLNGGGLIALESAPTLIDVDFFDNVTDEDGGAARIIETGAFSWTGGEVRGNVAAGVGGGVHFMTGGAPLLTNLLFAGNTAAGSSGGLLFEDTCGATVSQLTVVGNVSATDGAVTFLRPCVDGGSSAPNTLTNSIIAGNVATDGGGITTLDGAEVVVAYTNVHGNSVNLVGLADVVGHDGNVDLDPGFVSFGPALGSTSWDLHLGPASLLRNLGDPSLTNPDGTRSDPGAYGGQVAAYDYYADADADGLYDGWEALHGLDPTLDDHAGDPDADTLLNTTELSNGTDPQVADTDGDGRTDGVEVAEATDPLDPSG